MNEREIIERRDWLERAEQTFGHDPLGWRFACVSCGHVQCGHDFVEQLEISPAEAMSRVYFSCIGRWVPGVGCNWTLGGLFQIHKREVRDKDGELVPVFLFAGEGS